ncbi:CaiB/BaiF CoA transferase family protein [Novosphingobium rosa]|uniref:CaiB/BaiF CoA transferase family protein n=1 Tax=Novosphingobium rosa TaxID=76978 RepID=UPI00082B4009|nr:CaiB/BaiF CoA-transferase family protein [Novosphingobium rosa]
MTSGPLVGIRVVEFSGLGPGPYAGMFLSDLGAEVIEIAREGASPPRNFRNDSRGRKRICLNLKSPDAVETCLRLIEKADMTFEGNRPGVMERLGLGPEVMLARNPALVYGRMTGWGQHGPLAHAAGHDINYFALTGLLHAIGTAERPVPPLNLGADFGGGAMFLIAGMLAALLHARQTGKGQVVDTAMTDCASYLGSLFHDFQSAGLWSDTREANLLDGGAHFYGNYECADGKFVAIGSIEPQFYALLLEKTGAADKLPHAQMDTAHWSTMRATLGEVFRTKTRDEWCALMEGTDVCFAPVLTLSEARSHPHHLERQTFIEADGATRVAPAPRFSETPGAIQWAPSERVWKAEEILAGW